MGRHGRLSMMPVTHGIVKSIDFDFLLEIIPVNLGDVVPVNLTGAVGTSVSIDPGDGSAQVTVLTTSPQTINVTNVITKKITVTGNPSISTCLFQQVNTVLEYNFIDASSLTTLQSTFFQSAFLTKITLSNSRRLIDISGIANELFALTDFILTDAFSIIRASACLRKTPNLRNVTLGSFDSCLVLDFFYQDSGIIDAPALVAPAASSFDSVFELCSDMVSCGGIINSLPANYEAVFAECVLLECIGKIDTTGATNTINMFNNTPALTNPTVSEQTAILAGSNYINAGTCP